MAASVLNFPAFHAGITTMNRFPAQLDELGFNACLFEFLKHRFD